MDKEKKKIIIVDDNVENLTALKNTLKDNYEAYPCPSAAKMFDLLKHIRSDLILLDVEMPEMNGYEALQKLKDDDKYKDIPVLFLTSMNDARDELKGLSLGAVDYIRKPFVAPLLLQRIRTHLSVLEKENEIRHLLDLKTEEVKMREKAEQEAESASQAKGDFLSHMSHEIRSPLNAVIGMINIANEEKTLEGVKVYLEKAANAARHVLGVINDILDMSKIEANKLELSYGEFDFNKMMTNIVDVTGIRAMEKHIQISVNMKPDIPQFVICDELRLTQVITNLMTNAIKFTPDNGTVTLNVEMLENEQKEFLTTEDTEFHGGKEEPRTKTPCTAYQRYDETSVVNSSSLNNTVTLRIEVADSGIGISPEQQAKLFTAYNQADRTIAKQFGGTGLGLAISKRIIELMGGKIWIESELGKGAKFIFTLKMKKGTQTPAPAGTETSGTDAAALTSLTSQTGTAAGVPGIKASDLHLQGVTILAAEDMDFNREVLAKYLEKTGVTVDFAENGKEAVEKFKVNYEKYSLIFMDINMPEMNGDEATKLIRAYEEELNKRAAGNDSEEFPKETPKRLSECPKSIPIIAMTADVFKEDVEKCLSVGMNDHISKPVVPKILYAKIKQHLGL